MSDQNPEQFARSAPAGLPTGPAPVRTVELSRTRPVVAMAAYGVYALVCVVGLFVVNHRVSLANRVIGGDTSVTLDQANAADHAVTMLAVALIAAFILLVVAVIVAERNFHKALGKQAARRIQSQSGLRIVWIVWAVLWILGSVLMQRAVPSDPQSLVSSDHRTMFLLGARALMLAVIMALTPRTYRRAREELAARPPSQPYAPLGF